MFRSSMPRPAAGAQERPAHRSAPARTFIRRTVPLALAAVVSAAAVPATAGAAPRNARWAALGDSYTAGIFVGDPSPALGSPDRDGCDRTTGSYPHLVADALAAHPPGGRRVTLSDASCSGATVTDVTTTRQTPISPVQPPAGGWPSVPPQIDRAGLDAGTDVVTIGAGTNSLSLGPMFLACLVVGLGRPDDATPCRDAFESGDPALAPEPIEATYGRVAQEYAAMLATVRRRSPHAAVVTIGYPTIFPADASGCDRQDTTELAARISGLGLASVTHGDITWLHDVTARLNRIIRAVTELSGDTYLDTAAPSVGHDVCRPAAKRWVEGVCGTAGPYWPNELTAGAFTLTCSGDRRATYVHPDAAFHAAVAARVEAAVRAALT
ncbi:SGNH/GDSL hydrolase family protein [Streptomyces sp. NPDC021020]|uniref:SGNH/GDSL hydrolase family protein n=1 Tax=Streptomyces sp. NPDC021020 TaxID=3365109 RepID=UPI0037A099EE